MDLVLDETQPEDWQFVQEGINNVVLRYRGSLAQWRGKVVRLRKVQGAADIALQSIEEYQSLTSKVFLPLLGSDLIDIGHSATASTEFLRQMVVLVQPLRPEQRLVKEIDVHQRCVHVLTDLTSLEVDGGLGETVCFEIKPKWGIMPRAQSLIPEHAIKAHVCRFCMHQSYKLSKGQVTTRSAYCPMQLYSCTPTHVYSAVSSLMSTPQNNLRVFVNGEDLLRKGSDVFNAWLTSTFFSGFNRVQESGPLACRDVMIRIVVAVLLRSGALKRLLDAQKLDAFDIEGVYASYAARHGIDVSQHKLVPVPASLDLQDDSAMKRVFDDFMIATAAKDCSLMVSIRRVDSSQSGTHADRSSNAQGVIVCRGESFAYKLGVVDLDGRPVDRIPFYFEHDRNIVECFLQTSEGGSQMSCANRSHCDVTDVGEIEDMARVSA